MKTRSDSKAVESACGRHLLLALTCIREHWTCAEFSRQRGTVKLPEHVTQADSAQVYGFSQATWQMVFNGAFVEWRLGFADVATARGTGDDRHPVREVTHGGYFWKGTDKPWTDWSAL